MIIHKAVALLVSEFNENAGRGSYEKELTAQLSQLLPPGVAEAFVDALHGTREAWDRHYYP
jgi:hypothetical protein